MSMGEGAQNTHHIIISTKYVVVQPGLTKMAVYVMLFYVFFILIWHEDRSIHKYSLIKAKLQLQNNDPNIQTKNKNDLKYFYVTIIKFLFNYRE